MTGRDNQTVCAVPGCHRWTRRFPRGWEYLCPDHWNAVPAPMRRAYSRAVRRLVPPGPMTEEGPDIEARARSRLSRLWRACIRKAILRSGGLR